MEKIETMDRAALKRIDQVMKSALEMAAEELGLSVEIQGGKFDPTVGTYNPKIEFALDGAERRDFERMAPLFGATASQYRATFENRGKTFTLVGFNSRAPRYPLIVEDPQGRKYKFPESALGRILPKKEVAAA